MAITVTFVGKKPLPGADTGYRVWSYTVDPSPPGELPAGQRIALGLPRDMDIRDPADFPNVPALANTFLIRETGSSRQYVGRITGPAGVHTISFVAPAAESTGEALLVRLLTGQSPLTLPFATSPGGPQSPVQVLTTPVHGPPIYSGRPLSEFTGMLPYASELFGIYQPLAGWFGMQNTLRLAHGSADSALASLGHTSFAPADAVRTLDDAALAALAERFDAVTQGVLSPVGLVNFFRQYFFEFDTFLGPPAGHLWLSPGGTVELVETSTRRTLVERTAEQFEETTRKVEESLTEQEDIANAVKEDNANDTKLGVSASGGANVGIYHADASASFSVDTTVKRSSEETHKHSRTQSAKVASEIKRNFKTTFKTVTETTDLSSRRYIVQNTTDKLVNYELRRKMRKVGVQLQHIGARLCWQVYLPAPGRNLGLGDLVHIVPAPDLTSIRRPEAPPPLVPKNTQFNGTFPIRKVRDTQDPPEADMEFVHHAFPEAEGISNHANTIHAVARMDYTPSPPEADYKLKEARLISVAPGRAFTAAVTRVNPEKTGFAVFTSFFHSGDLSPIGLTFELIWDPPQTNAAHDRYQEELKVYQAEVAALQRTAYASAVRDRLGLISAMRTRPSPDLRTEERQVIYGSLIHKLKPFELFDDLYLGSELLRQIFDVDEMLYFVAPDYWRPHTVPEPEPPVPAPPTMGSVGKYPVPDPTVLTDRTVVTWYSHTDKTNAINPQGQDTEEWRINYLITEQSQPAPLGSSLGWLIQADGDSRRNEFLNAAWAKAVLPVRPGRERAALEWLEQAEVEGQAALGLPYPFQAGDPPEYEGKTVGQVLDILATRLQESNTAIGNTLAAEEVFETGFDPLDGGFRPAAPYEVFDQWIEVLPTDQVVAVEVQYDPKTGQQL